MKLAVIAMSFALLFGSTAKAGSEYRDEVWIRMLFSGAANAAATICDNPEFAKVAARLDEQALSLPGVDRDIYFAGVERATWRYSALLPTCELETAHMRTITDVMRLAK